MASMTRRTTTSRIALLVVAGAIAGCDTPEDPFVLHEEDFETVCAGTPCGWAQITGPDDAVRYVETLPGDHGLELVGDDVTVRGGPGEIPPDFYQQLSARLVARCDPGAVLDVRATFELRDRRTVTFEASFGPPSDWSAVLPDESLRPVDPVPPPWELTRVLGVSLRKTGAGSCEVDYVALRWVRAF